MRVRPGNRGTIDAAARRRGIFVVKALFLLMLFGLLAVSRIFDSDEEREEVQRIRKSLRRDTPPFP